MQTSRIYHGGGGKRSHFSTGGGGTSEDVKVKVSGIDTTSNYLALKMSFVDLGVSILNPGGDERLEVSNPSEDGQWLSFQFANPNVLSVMDLIPAASDGPWSAVGQGLYLGDAYTLEEWHILINEYSTNGPAQSILFELRRIDADGSRTSAVSMVSGTLVDTLRINFSNTSSASWYYKGDRGLSLSDAIPSNQMIFPVVTERSANLVEGVSMSVLLRKT